MTPVEPQKSWNCYQGILGLLAVIMWLSNFLRLALLLTDESIHPRTDVEDLQVIINTVFPIGDQTFYLLTEPLDMRYRPLVDASERP